MTKQLEINQARVHQVVMVATQATAYEVRGLHPVEAIIGFSEVVGRAIAAQEGTPILHNELIRIAVEHIKTTVRAAYASNGKDGNAIREH